jgi:hypothetical protein
MIAADQVGAGAVAESMDKVKSDFLDRVDLI